MILTEDKTALAVASSSAAAGDIPNGVPRCWALRITPGGASPGGYPLALQPLGISGTVRIESDAAMYFAEEFPGGTLTGGTPGGTYSVHYATLKGEGFGPAALRGRKAYQAVASVAVPTAAPVGAVQHFSPPGSTRNVQAYFTGAGNVTVWQRSVSGVWFAGQSLVSPGMYSLTVDAALPLYFQADVGGIAMVVDAEAEIG